MPAVGVHAEWHAPMPPAGQPNPASGRSAKCVPLARSLPYPLADHWSVLLPLLALVADIRALSMHQPSTAGSASLLEHKPSAADMDPNAKINQLIELQAKIKSSTREILQCCERLKTLPNDQHRKPVLADFLTVFRPLRDSLRRFIELTNSVVTVVDLRRSGIELMKFEKEITSDMVAGTVKSLDEFRHLLASINTNIEFVMRRYPQNERRLMIKPTAGFKEEGSYEASIIAEDRPIHGKNPYRDYILEHVPDAQYYRRHFVNDPHTTYIGVMEKLGPVIISLRKEELQDRAGGGEHGQSSERAYRAILRIKEQTERRELINPAQIKKSILGKVSTRSILQLLHKDLNPSKLKVVDDKSVEQRVMALDELRHSAKYKIGVILVQPGQTTDNEYLGNAGGSEGYERFLGILGDRVELKGFKGFAGGLDTSNGRTGTHSIYTCWRKFEIMFHVATMLPLLSADEQHIDRKRHIGNDIINIVYLEGDAQFDPNSIRSQFTHVFIVVKEEPHVADDASPGGGAETGQPGYRVAVASNSDVPRFGPLLPEPSVFVNMGELREFLMCKMINGENAAYKAPKFAKPHQRTHHAMFDSIIEDFAANMSRKPSRNDSERRHDRFWSREHVVDPSGQHQAAAASSSAAASPASSVMSPMSPQLKPASFVHSSSSNLRSLLPGATPAQSHGASPTSADIPRATAAAAAMDRLRVLHKRASAHVVDRADSNASSPSAGAGGPTAGAAATIPALTLAAALSDTDLRSTSDLDNESLGSGLGDSTSGLTSDSHSRTNLSLGGSTAAAGPGSTTAWLDDPRGLTHTDANAATMCIHDDPLSRAVLADGAV
nr:Signal-induced proliferation-associated 1-like protein 1 [Polyrhizophydium stewartii]